MRFILFYFVTHFKFKVPFFIAFLFKALYTQSQAQFNTYVHSGTVLNNYAHIFDILIRLRQAVDHPYLVIYSDKQHHQSQVQQPLSLPLPSSSSKKKSVSSKSKASADWSDCPLCHEEIVDGVRAECGCAFCRICISDFLETVAPEEIQRSSAADNNDDGDDDDTNPASIKRKKKAAAVKPAKGIHKTHCPNETCGKPLTIDLSSSMEPEEEEVETPEPERGNDSVSIWDEQKCRKNSIMNRIDLNVFQSSTKMESLLQELHRMIENDSGSKALVFSQFVNMLDLLEYRIKLGGIGCVKLLGHMNINERDLTIKKFQNDVSTRVMLISLKAGLVTDIYVYTCIPHLN